MVLLVVGIGIRLQDLSRVYHVLLGVLVDISSRLQALFCVYHSLLDSLILPWTLEYQVDNIANEQSKQGDLRCHAEETDHEANIEAQCRNETNKSCYYQAR